MSGLPWFRMYAEAVDDEKMRLIAFEDRWHFVALLCCACKGLFDSGDEWPKLQRKLAIKLGVQLRELDEIHRRLMEVDLVDESMRPVNWDKRQRRSDHDPTAAERQRRHRESRNRNALRNGGVTRPEGERETEAEGEGEEEQEPESSAGRSPPQPAKSKNGAGSRIPDDFSLTDERKEAAKRQGLSDSEAQAEIDKFVDYWQSQPGQKGRKANWDATWRNWCRRAVEYRGRTPGQQQPKGGSLDDASPV